MEKPQETEIAVSEEFNEAQKPGSSEIEVIAPNNDNISGNNTEEMPSLLQLNIVSSVQMSKEDVKKLPYWAHLFVNDVNDRKTWALPYRDNRGYINKHLLSTCREQLTKGKVNGSIKISIKINSRLEGFINKVLAATWPGIPKIKINESLLVGDENTEKNFGCLSIVDDADELHNQTKTLLGDVFSENDEENEGESESEDENDDDAEDILYQQREQKKIEEQIERGRRGAELLQMLRMKRLSNNLPKTAVDSISNKPKVVVLDDSESQSSSSGDESESSDEAVNLLHITSPSKFTPSQSKQTSQRLKATLLRESRKKVADDLALHAGFKSFKEQMKFIKRKNNSKKMNREGKVGTDFPETEFDDYVSDDTEGPNTKEIKILAASVQGESKNEEKMSIEATHPEKDEVKQVDQKEDLVPKVHPFFSQSKSPEESNKLVTKEPNMIVEKENGSGSDNESDGSDSGEEEEKISNERYKQLLERENNLAKTKRVNRNKNFFEEEASEGEEYEEYKENYIFGAGPPGLTSAQQKETDLFKSRIREEDLENIVDEVNEDVEALEKNEQFHREFINEKEQKDLENLYDDIKKKRLRQRRRNDRSQRINAYLEADSDSESSDEEKELARQVRYERLDNERKALARTKKTQKTDDVGETLEQIDEEINQQQQFLQFVKEQKQKHRLTLAEDYSAGSEEETRDATVSIKRAGSDDLTITRMSSTSSNSTIVRTNSLHKSISIGLGDSTSNSGTNLSLGGKKVQQRGFSVKNISTGYVFQKATTTGKKRIYSNSSNWESALKQSSRSKRGRSELALLKILSR